MEKHVRQRLVFSVFLSFFSSFSLLLGSQPLLSYLHMMATKRSSNFMMFIFPRSFSFSLSFQVIASLPFCINSSLAHRSGLLPNLEPVKQVILYSCMSHFLLGPEAVQKTKSGQIKPIVDAEQRWYLSASVILERHFATLSSISNLGVLTSCMINVDNHHR